MLTPTDIHLLVGLFSKLTTPENVDIVLGDMIYDKASQSNRDIDVTIRYKNDLGEEVLFVGLQVKDHNRKLGSPEVEQLCAHFKDSIAIKRGGIISASGFTKPAINKAAYHGIDLYNFRDFDTGTDLQHIKFPPDFQFHEIREVFTQKPDVNYSIDIEENLSNIDISSFNENTPVFNIDGTAIDRTINIGDLNNNFINQILQHETIRLKLDKALEGEVFPINVTLHVENPPVAILGETKLLLNRVTISGSLIKEVHKIKTIFKILVKIDNPLYQVGGLISELPDNSLIGLITSTLDQSLQIITIPIAERNKKKIYKIKIK